MYEDYDLDFIIGQELIIFSTDFMYIIWFKFSDMVITLEGKLEFGNLSGDKHYMDPSSGIFIFDSLKIFAQKRIVSYRIIEEDGLFISFHDDLYMKFLFNNSRYESFTINDRNNGLSVFW